MTFPRSSLRTLTVGLLAGAVVFGLCSSVSAFWETIVDGSSFASTNAFTNKWAFNYPWGTDHNGSARMNASNVTISAGVVTVRSTLTNTYEGASSKDPFLTIRYNSGTFYLKQKITINSQFPVWDISVQARVPSATGTWPAFWMTGANSWPPESDFMEFKGSATCYQNTYNGSWQSVGSTVSSPGSAWHTYRVVANLENSTNVDFHYYIDGAMKTEQTSTTFVGSPCWLIVDYQMEGSSGSPGPNNPATFSLTNLVVKRENISGVAAGPVANGAYKLLVRSSGQTLDVGSQATANNSLLDQWPSNGGLNQQWTVTHLGNSQYTIIGRQSGRALEMPGATTNNGARADIADYVAGSHQMWRLVATSGGYYNLVNVSSGKVLEVSNNSTANFAPVDQWLAAIGSRPQISPPLLSDANVVLTGTGAIPGNGYSVLSSADAAVALTNWSVLGTVTGALSGSFSFTNSAAPDGPQQFFGLQLPSNGGYNQQWSFQGP